MTTRKAFSGLTVIEFLILVVIVGVVLLLVFMGIKSSQRKKAVVSFKDNVMSIRGVATMCAGESSGVLKSGVTGEPICVNGEGVYPEVSPGCGEAPVFYFIDSRVESWKLTTTTDLKGRTNWDCHGCRPICQASRCDFIETKPGDCY